MNKYFKILPAAAIVVGLAGSAFTGASETNTKSANTQEPELYWHQVRADETLGPVINASNPQTKSESMPSGSNPLTPCNDNSAIDCLQGFEAPQSEGTDANPTPASNERIGYN